MDGTELLTKINEGIPGRVKIVLTGGPKERAVQTMELEADGYLSKPVNPERLLAVLEESLRKNPEESQKGSRNAYHQN